MKTALYTIFRCTNYGAVLQAYALARTLRGILGDEAVDVINHRMDPRDTHLLGKITNPNTPWFQRWRNKRKFAARYFRPDLFEQRRAKTVALIQRQIRPTGHLYKDPAELAALPSYSTVVVGSDQIWNPSLNHDFGHNQYLATDIPDSQDRVAYAASFGISKLPDSSRSEYAAALRRFSSITVREETGADICESLLGARPPVVLDPTMLLSAEEWREAVASDDSSAKESYIAAYWVRTVTQQDVDALAAWARQNKTSVRLMSAGPLPKLDFKPEIVPVIDADPFDFVREIAEADQVVTDSFHGLQFSTVFAKPFIVLGNLSDHASNASRLVDFCARYGLSEGVADIDKFRVGDIDRSRPADFKSFDMDRLVSDRRRSTKLLKGLLK